MVFLWIPHVANWIFQKRPWRFFFSRGQSWLDSNPEADAEEIKEKHKEIEGAVLKLKTWGWLMVTGTMEF